MRYILQPSRGTSSRLQTAARADREAGSTHAGCWSRFSHSPEPKGLSGICFMFDSRHHFRYLVGLIPKIVFFFIRHLPRVRSNQRIKEAPLPSDAFPIDPS